MDMNKEENHDDHDHDSEDNYFTIVPEAGMCLVGDVIVNLRQVTVIQKQGSQTLLYQSGVKEPITLPGEVFEDIREAVFSMDDLDFEDEDFACQCEDEEDYDLDDDEEEEDEEEEETPPVGRKRRK